VEGRSNEGKVKSLVEALQFIFADMWRFLGVAFLLAIFAMWKPVEINILHDNREDKGNGSKSKTEQ